VVAIHYFSLADVFVYLGILLSILLGFFSSQYIEKIKFRADFSNLLSFRKCKPLYMALIVGSLSGVAYLLNGLESRGSNNMYSYIKSTEKLNANHGLSPTCDGSFTLSPDCRTSDEPEILVWGDSFAMHLVSGILASNPDAKLIQLTKSSCGPYFDISKVKNGSFSDKCLEFTESVREWIKNASSLKYVVISSPFEYETESKVRFRNGEERVLRKGEASEKLQKTLRELEEMGVIPIVFSPPPKSGENIGNCLDRRSFFGRSLTSCDFSRNQIVREQVVIYSWLSELAHRHKVIKLDDYLCSTGECKTHFGNIYIYRDIGHLSSEGSRKLGRELNFYKLISSQ
jgi:hypothetical protein